MQALRSLYARFEVLIHEIAKFGIVGILAFIIDVAISNALHHGENVGPLTAKACSTVVATIFAYAGNRYWSFRHRQSQSVKRELPIFVILNVIGLAITEAFIAFTYYVLHLHGALAYNISGNLLGTGVATVFRFSAYKKWVFTHPGEATDPLEAAAVVQV